MAVNRFKLASLLIAALFAAGTGMAVEGYDGHKTNPHIISQPVEAPNGSTPNITLPGLSTSK